MKQLKLLLLLLLPLVLACTDKEEVTQKSNDLLKFEFRKEHNEGLLENTVVAEIDGQNVKVTLPGELRNEMLVAYFEHNGVDVLIDRVPQKSGVTKNDFSQPITYDIGAGELSYKS